MSVLLSHDKNKCKKLHASEAAYAHFLLTVHKDIAMFDFLQNSQ